MPGTTTCVSAGLILYAVFALSGLAARVFYQTQPAQLIRGSIPFSSGQWETGRAVVALRIGADGWARPTVTESDPPGAGSLVARQVQNWRFDARAADLALMVRYFHKPCSRNLNPYVEIRVPTGIDVHEVPICLEGSLTDALPTVRRSTLRGIVRSEGGGPLSGVVVGASRLASTGGYLSRRVVTDAGGRFEINGLPPSTYSVSVQFSNLGYVDSFFEMVVAADAPTDELALTLRRDPHAAEWPPAVVKAADMPSYPTAALAGGVEGSVVLRLSMNVDNVIDVDATGSNPVLVQAAKENVESWRFVLVTVPVLIVKYTFRLEPGDCSAEQRPLAKMRFPNEVEISAKKRVPCGTIVPRSAR